MDFILRNFLAFLRSKIWFFVCATKNAQNQNLEFVHFRVSLGNFISKFFLSFLLTAYFTAFFSFYRKLFLVKSFPFTPYLASHLSVSLILDASSQKAGQKRLFRTKCFYNQERLSRISAAKYFLIYKKRMRTRFIHILF